MTSGREKDPRETYEGGVRVTDQTRRRTPDDESVRDRTDAPADHRDKRDVADRRSNTGEKDRNDPD